MRLSDDIAIRRRRAIYRAAHRGTREMDWLLGRYAEARAPSMAEDDLARFERLLAHPDPDLQAMIMNGTLPADEELAAGIVQVRGFHGLGR